MFVEVHAFGTLCFFILTRGRFAVIASFHAAILASAFFASQRPLTSDQKHPTDRPVVGFIEITLVESRLGSRRSPLTHRSNHLQLLWVGCMLGQRGRSPTILLE